jgi:hypothetical protein
MNADGASHLERPRTVAGAFAVVCSGGSSDPFFPASVGPREFIPTGSGSRHLGHAICRSGLLRPAVSAFCSAGRRPGSAFFGHPDRSGGIVAGRKHRHSRWNHLPAAPAPCLSSRPERPAFSSARERERRVPQVPVLHLGFLTLIFLDHLTVARTVHLALLLFTPQFSPFPAGGRTPV